MAPHIIPAAQLRQLIYYNLDHNLLKNALFFAQHLVAYETRSPDAAYLLALVLFQSGFTKAAWDVSRVSATKGTHLGCCYVFAQVCLDLGRYVDGLHAIEKSKHFWQTRNTWCKHSESRREHLPDAAAMLCLKGKLWKGHKNMDEAVQCWVQAVKINPFMWDAVQELTTSGAKINIPRIFSLNTEMSEMVKASYVGKENVALDQEKAYTQPQPKSLPSVMYDPFTAAPKMNGAQGSAILFEKLNNSKVSASHVNGNHDTEGLATPSISVNGDEEVLHSSQANMKWEIPQAPLRKQRQPTDGQPDMNARIKAVSSRARTRLKTDENPVADSLPSGQPAKRTISSQVTSMPPPAGEPARRSTRLQTTRPTSQTSSTTVPSKMSTLANSLGLRETRDIKKPKVPTVSKPRTATTTTVGRVVSGNRIKTESQDLDAKHPNSSQFETQTYSAVPMPPPQKQLRDLQVEKEISALRELLALNSQIAMAQHALAMYDTTTCINILQALPQSQRDTPSILSLLGRAHYECAQYPQAEKHFIRVRQLAPSQLTDMEIYSTTLWHLKSDIELAYLGHELSEIERNSPQTWIAIGNSFSLQREHEQALKCFSRSTQLDPGFAYGFTLQGHEYIANEEFEKALEAYRSAISVEPRHYNAWYGLGKVYEKLGKYSVAETHYRTAASINPSNAVLMCCIGMVLEKTKQLPEALKFYDRACRLSPNSALSRFKKARCLMAMGQPEEALLELEILKEIAPNEANVWFLMGRLYKMVGRRAEAVRSFTVALNLDPKAAQFIKDAMESLDDEDDGADDDDEDMV